MPKTQTISARVDPELKENVERIFNELGLTSSQAITLFYKQVELLQGLPFSVRLPIPNEETSKAIYEARKRKTMTEVADVDELFNAL